MLHRLAVPAVALALAVPLAGCGDGDDEPARPAQTTATTTTAAPPAVDDAAAERIARRHVRKELGLEVRGEVKVLRSERDPRWVLVDGGDGRELWAVWLRDGQVVLAADEVAAFDPPQVPCDLRPAFSEPRC